MNNNKIIKPKDNSNNKKSINNSLDLEIKKIIEI